MLLIAFDQLACAARTSSSVTVAETTVDAAAREVGTTLPVISFMAFCAIFSTMFMLMAGVVVRSGSACRCSRGGAACGWKARPATKTVANSMTGPFELANRQIQDNLGIWPKALRFQRSPHGI